MVKGLSGAQRKAVEGAEAVTGRVAAREEVCAQLVAAGLAVRHGRVGHRGVYLTPEGRRVREELAARASARAAGTKEPPGTSRTAGPPTAERAPDPTAADPTPDPTAAERTAGPPAPERAAASPTAGPFTADDGSGAVAQRAGRAGEVAAAWEGLVQIRAVLGDGATEVPAAWERERQVHAVALALEAAGVPPARPGGSHGYRVRPSGHPGLTEVTWSEGEFASAALARTAALLPALGWQATEHRTREGAPYLLVSPRQR